MTRQEHRDAPGKTPIAARGASAYAAERGPAFHPVDSMASAFEDWTGASEEIFAEAEGLAGATTVTEEPNPLTANIDVANAEGIVRLMRQSDAQTINGYQDHAAIADRQMLDMMAETADRVYEMLDRPGRGRVVFSGAGTSGRLAMMAAGMLNHALRQRRQAPVAAYTIPGGEAAMVVAQENAEDSPELGVRDLERAIKGAKNIVYIGVTCGLSAPYVMGQADWLRERDNALVVLIGFTPPNRARASRVEGWDRTCAEVVADLAADPRHAVIAPVVGPETIAGSTRLKGATATNIIIQMLTFWAMGRAGVLTRDEEDQFGFKKEERALDSMRRMLRIYEDARAVTYLQSDHLAALIHRAGAALREGRHLYYLGSGRYGALGLIDAAECPPTFGAELGETRGFVEGGWSALLDDNKPPKAVDAKNAPYYRIGLDDFEKEILPTIQEGDVVVGIGEGMVSDEVRRLLAASKANGATTGAIVPMRAPDLPWLDVDVFTPIELVRPGITNDDRSYAELAVKVALNCVSTGAYVLAGKVFGNRMIDLKLTNTKLFERAERMICELMGVTRRAANAALVSAIHDTDSPGPEINATVGEHCHAAAARTKVVPTAMLLATGRFALAEAKAALRADPIVRNLIDRHVRHA